MLLEDVLCWLHGSVYPAICCIHLEGLFRSQVLVHLYKAKEYTQLSPSLRIFSFKETKKSNSLHDLSVFSLICFWKACHLMCSLLGLSYMSLWFGWGFMETETAWVEKRNSPSLELRGVFSLWVLSHLCFYDPLTLAGMQTGRCIEYEGKLKTCEVFAWCPVEAVENAPEWVRGWVGGDKHGGHQLWADEACQALLLLPSSAQSCQAPGLTGLVTLMPGTLVVSGRTMLVVKNLKLFSTGW